MSSQKIGWVWEGGKYQGLLRFSSQVPSQFREGYRDDYPPVHFNDPIANSLEAFPENALFTTKYTLLSFIPKLLYEQFRRATSIYFLGIAIIATIPEISPFNPITSWLGLLFILTISAIREGYEDYLRYKADLIVNNAIYTTIANQTGVEEPTRSYAIKVGNMVLLRSDERVPVDLVLLSSSREDGTAFIETAQLDGETNLKRRCVTSEPYHKLSPVALAQLAGIIRADVPNHHIYNFKGSMEIDGEREPISLNENNLLLASTIIRNTEWVIGICVYAGPETKVGLNLRLPPSKFSTLDKKLNRYILFLFGIKMVLCVLLTILNAVFLTERVAITEGLLDPSEAFWFTGFKGFWTYFALLNYIIPLSLVVTLDVVRFIQASFIQWDQEMTYLSQTATAKTSNLNDELAMVDYIFSDKTGTLTENLMIFKKASINGNIYEDNIRTLIDNPIDEKSLHFAMEYLYTLALAHSCQTDMGEFGGSVFKSASPDEEALCRAAQKNGFVFKGRRGKLILLDVLGKEEIFELLVEMEFTPDRRRMSVIVRTPEGKIKLYTKGADVSIIGRLANTKKNKDRLESTNNDLQQFSLQGLRTLLVGVRNLEEEEFSSFWKEYVVAINLLEGRENEVERLCDLIETNLTLIGATAIEDKLQEGVPQTISNIKIAGIKIWVITGDKQETAINIGYAAHLLSSDMDILKFNARDAAEVFRMLQKAKKDYVAVPHHGSRPFSIIIDGLTLTYVLANLRTEFITVAKYATTAICNRVTPLQKAEIISLVQGSLSSVCLAIGDGGNDVSMIQQADIGVGIKGKEGSEAERAADFVLPQFQFLEKLLLVHGRYSLLRNTKVIYQSFYKNVMTFMSCVWFSFFSGASGIPLYDSWTMLLYNTVFTSLPTFSIGLFEKDLHEWIILKNPRIYRASRKLQSRALFHWVTNAMFHSLFIFFGCWAVQLDTPIFSDGHTTDFHLFGMFVMFISFHVALCKLLLETNHWVIWVGVAYVVSLAGFYICELLLSIVIDDISFVFTTLLNVPALWIGLVLAIPTCLVTDISFKYYNRQVWPKMWYILQEQNKTKEKLIISHLQGDSRTSPLLMGTDETYIRV